jgi:hypothetical protein
VLTITRHALALALFALPTAAFGQARYKIDIEEKQTVTGTLVFASTFQDLQAKEWIAFAAVAPALPGQTKPKSTFDFAKAEVSREKGGPERAVLTARIAAKTDEQKSSINLKVVYTATLHSRRLAIAGESETPKVAAPSAAERKVALADQGDIDFKSEAFQKWMKEAGYVRRKTECDVAYGRRVFLGLRASYTYEFKVGMERKASSVCGAGKSDCGGLSMLFAAVLRANGVPARTLYGRWATSAKANDKLGEYEYCQWHVKAEFYAADVGWVPADLAVSILSDKSADGLEHFGQDPGDFITMHVDANFVLDTVTFGKQPIHNLQYPTFWVSGSGKLDRRKEKETWTVEVVK